MSRDPDLSPIPMLDLQAEVAELWDEIMPAVERVLKGGQVIGGPEVEAFEAEAAAYLGVRHAVGLNSGTDALVIGLRALGIGPGDEVITTAFSFFATAEAIANVGATPVFVDIRPGTFDLDPDLVERAITERTRAILPVHLYGRPAAMTRVVALAREHDLEVIEDCAQSVGAAYHGRCSECDGSCDPNLRDEMRGTKTGAIGDAAAFSFYPTKNLGAYGDAGMLATDDDAVARAARGLRNHGQRPGRRYRHDRLGYNSRLDALQAAVLRVKLPRLEAWNARRCEIAARYREHLTDVEGLTLPVDDPGHVYHQFTVRVGGGRRDAVRDALATAGIASGVYYPVTLPQLMADAGATARSGPVLEAERAADEVLSLPLHPFLHDHQVERVAERVRSACAP